ncbi:MAG: 4-(cytidine 5'-diphospho)-2-C-methyl-D-erythritol kinase [Ruminococcus flavefaciens]|nr:4-(cytidine 5'-diphospho)-2-C-methyl-D-erythritol kinase [Ruminococcus flavefaciens]MCM1058927.1 4-(cytidine 5'-diphospho)-2-C-methyl-D-erythritol kinase [Eubacterium sp.]
MRIKTAAKINLALDVSGKLENGYHIIKSVFQTVGIYDEVSVELIAENDEIIVNCVQPEQLSQADIIPCGEKNIAFKAAKLFLESQGINAGCVINIKKSIPSRAGMGGGSSDAAAVLYCLNELTEAGLAKEKLSMLGKKLGADVPFFFTGGTAYVGGIGEEITPISDYSGRKLVVAKGVCGVSTADAYKKIDALEASKHPDADALVRLIENVPDKAYTEFGNLFEEAVQLEEVANIKKIILECGALNAVMTGSGSAVFGLFNESSAAEKCVAKLKKHGFFAEICETVKESFI